MFSQFIYEGGDIWSLVLTGLLVKPRKTFLTNIIYSNIIDTVISLLKVIENIYLVTFRLSP